MGWRRAKAVPHVSGQFKMKVCPMAGVSRRTMRRKRADVAARVAYVTLCSQWGMEVTEGGFQLWLPHHKKARSEQRYAAKLRRKANRDLRKREQGRLVRERLDDFHERAQLRTLGIHLDREQPPEKPMSQKQREIVEANDQAHDRELARAEPRGEATHSRRGKMPEVVRR